MIAYDLSVIHKQAQENFQGKRKVVVRGENILKELARIAEVLKKLENLKTVHVSSPNDCGWRPEIPDHEVREFVHSTLAKKEKLLLDEFDRIFGNKQT